MSFVTAKKALGKNVSSGSSGTTAASELSSSPSASAPSRISDEDPLIQKRRNSVSQLVKNTLSPIGGDGDFGEQFRKSIEAETSGKNGDKGIITGTASHLYGSPVAPSGYRSAFTEITAPAGMLLGGTAHLDNVRRAIGGRDLLGGGGVFMFAGEKGGGKTVLSAQLAWEVLRSGGGVVVFDATIAKRSFFETVAELDFPGRGLKVRGSKWPKERPGRPCGQGVGLS